MDDASLRARGPARTGGVTRRPAAPAHRCAGVVVALAVTLIAAAACQQSPSRTAAPTPAAGPGAPRSSGPSSGGPSSSGASPGASGTAVPPGGTPTSALVRYPADSPLATRPHGGAATAVGVAAALRPALGVPALHGRLAAVVVDPVTGRTLYSANPDLPLTPASSMKMLTAVAAVDTVGAGTRFTTKVLRTSAPGPDPTIALGGGGDISLARVATPPGHPPPAGGTAGGADLATLAARTVAALPGVRTVHLSWDATRYSGPAVDPAWRASYLVTGQVSPVSALTVDQGRVGPGRRQRSPDPAAAAAGSFAAALKARGITATVAAAGAAAPATAPALASVTSPPVAELIGHMLTASDNDYAESLLRHIALATGRPATFAGGAAAVVADLARRSIGPAGIRMLDGSGLAGSDTVTVAELAALHVAALRDPTLRPVADGLAVAGVSGTVRTGFTGPAAPARGRVRVKTGTLAGISALSGAVTTASAGQLVFAVVVDGLATNLPYASRTALERAAAALVPCGCGAPPPPRLPATPGAAGPPGGAPTG